MLPEGPSTGSVSRGERDITAPAITIFGQAMIYDFDDFTLDLRRFELSHRGQSIALEPQVFDVRAHLVENHDRVVTKGELLETPDLKEARALLEVAAR